MGGLGVSRKTLTAFVPFDKDSFGNFSSSNGHHRFSFALKYTNRETDRPGEK